MTAETCSAETRTSACTLEDLYAYKAQRWIWNESRQLRSRYVRFDLKALIKAAEEAAGEDAVCENVSKLPEGNFNKALLVTMRDGRQLVVKIPNPNAGPSHYTTASEVATMAYVRENLKVPAPKVLAYCTRASESKLGSEYIIMDKAPGIELGRIWGNMKPRDKIAIVKQLATITAKLSQARFDYYGSIYYQRDISGCDGIKVDDTFAIGPTVGRSWFDDRRGDINVYRGPWRSTSEFINGLVQREILCLDTFPEFPRDCQQGIFNGPDGYHPAKEAKLSVLQGFLKVAQYILPKRESLNAAVLWHNDLHSENIFVDEANPSQITSIIDWQAVPVYPMFLMVHHPSLVDHDGPKLEGFTKPSLPENIKDLNPKEQKAAKELFLAQSLWLLYETQVQKEAPDLLHAFRYRETLPGQILGLIGSTFDDGEPHVQSLLADVAKDDIWKKLVGTDDSGNPNVPCPLKYSQDDLERQKLQYAKWERDIERKAQILDAIGVYTGWNGAVSPDEYEEVARRLENAKRDFLDREARTPEERERWEQVWPFKDDAK